MLNLLNCKLISVCCLLISLNFRIVGFNAVFLRTTNLGLNQKKKNLIFRFSHPFLIFSGNMWLIILGVICVLFYYYCIKPMNHWKKLGVKEGSPVWLFGDTINMVLKKEGFTELLLRLYNEHPNER